MKKVILLLMLLLCCVFLSSCGSNNPAEVEDAENADEYVGYFAINGENDNDNYYFEYEGYEAYEPFTEPEPGVRIFMPEQSLRDFSSDAQFLVDTVEAVHPIFVIDGFLPDNYEAVRATFLEETSGYMTLTDFILASRRFITVLQDGHMNNGLHDTVMHTVRTPVRLGRYISTLFIARDYRLYLANEPYTEVVAIGGVPVLYIFYQVDRHYFSENEVYRMFNYTRYVGSEIMLHLAGVEIYMYNRRTQTILTLLDNGKTSYMPVNFTALNPITELNATHIIRHEMIDDIFFIDLREFILGPHIYQTADAIREAVDAGYTHFILDLRGNGGGSTRVGNILLNAMGMNVPSDGVYRRISQLVLEQREWINPDTEIDSVRFWPPSTKTAANPNNITLLVLTDNLSYSSSTAIAAWVQDGNLGKIVGEPSRNAPSAFGDMLDVILPYSGLRLSISHARFLRPDTNADQTTLWPDIPVNAEYALEAAIEYIRGRQ